jgi:hypothetical protein
MLEEPVNGEDREIGADDEGEAVPIADIALEGCSTDEESRQNKQNHEKSKRDWC